MNLLFPKGTAYEEGLRLLEQTELQRTLAECARYTQLYHKQERTHDEEQRMMHPMARAWNHDPSAPAFIGALAYLELRQRSIVPRLPYHELSMLLEKAKECTHDIRPVWVDDVAAYHRNYLRSLSIGYASVFPECHLAYHWIHPVITGLGVQLGWLRRDTETSRWRICGLNLVVLHGSVAVSGATEACEQAVRQLPPSGGRDLLTHRILDRLVHQVRDAPQ